MMIAGRVGHGLLGEVCMGNRSSHCIWIPFRTVCAFSRVRNANQSHTPREASTNLLFRSCFSAPRTSTEMDYTPHQTAVILELRKTLATLQEM